MDERVGGWGELEAFEVACVRADESDEVVGGDVGGVLESDGGGDVALVWVDEVIEDDDWGFAADGIF
jgi:hypothetical protein